jgi:cell division septation protein DedD
VRDEGKIREKIEVRLDGRQVVGLLVGAAVVLGTVFYLGVAVGKDLAGPAVASAPVPLDELDQQVKPPAPPPAPELRFEQVLTGDAPPAAPPSDLGAAPAPEAPKPVAKEPAKALPSATALLAAADAKAGEWAVQAASLPTRADADAFVKKLSSRGVSPYVVEAEVPGKGTYYRIRVGRFASKDAADRYLADFKRETGLPAIVTPTGR